jgi:predicted TIM-barrel fold metal-dependent hydrolase
VDASSFLGEWPSRRLNGSPAPAGEALVEGRLRLMDRLGVRRAAVSRLESVWLKDAGVGNAELFALVGRLPARFFPVYTLDPTFPSWPEQLDRCVETYGLAAGTGAIRLLPTYHGYGIGQTIATGSGESASFDECLERLEALGLPVVLTLQLDDTRMQHPGMRVPDLAVADVVAAVSRRPALRWVVTGALQTQMLAIARQLPPDARVWFELSRVQGPIDGIPMLRDRIGVDRLLFGTNLPLHVAESPIVELADAWLSPDEDAAVRYGNARQALGID